MSMIFQYTPLPVPVPVWTLNGRMERPRPIVTISLIGPSTTIVRRALLDTGADDTVLPEDLAALLGIDLSLAPTGEARGMSGLPLTVRFATVTIRMTDGHEFKEWPARVGFAAIQMRRPLLGFAGCLQYLDVLFLGADEVFEMTANHLFPAP